MFSLENMPILVAAVVLFILWFLELFIPFLPGRPGKIKHSLRNITIGAFNALIITLLFFPLFYGLTNWTKNNDFGLLHLINLPVWASAIPAILLQDGWMYFWHRINHRLPFLWRFHRVHHSDPKMDVSTAVRFHTGEILMAAVLRLGLIALAGLSLWQIVLYDLILIPVIFFHHSNVRFPEKWDSFYRLLFASPAMHRIHHSPERIKTDSNYGSIFSFWDRLARSFRLRENDSEAEYGLNEFKAVETESLSILALMPVKK